MNVWFCTNDRLREALLETAVEQLNLMEADQIAEVVGIFDEYVQSYGDDRLNGCARLLDDGDCYDGPVVVVETLIQEEL